MIPTLIITITIIIICRQRKRSGKKSILSKPNKASDQNTAIRTEAEFTHDSEQNFNHLGESYETIIVFHTLFGPS